MSKAFNLFLGDRSLVEGGNIPGSPTVVDQEIYPIAFGWAWSLDTPVVAHTATLDAAAIDWPWSMQVPFVEGDVTPIQAAEFYLTASGAGVENGSSWDDAFGSFAAAAAAVPTGSTVFVRPSNYTINTTVSYSNKAIMWIGPERCAGQLQGTTGNVYISGSATRYFDVGGVANGGGFQQFAFNVDGPTEVTGDCVRMSGQTNFQFIGCYSKGSDNRYEDRVPLLRVVGSNPVDRLFFQGNNTHSGRLLWAQGLSPGTSAKYWRIDHNNSQKGNAPGLLNGEYRFVDPSINLSGGANFDGAQILGAAYVECNTSPAVNVNMTGVSGDRRVHYYLPMTERDDYPSTLFTACRPGAIHPGGRYGDTGSMSGVNTVEGFIAAPPYRLYGDLVPGVN